ncbi:MAG: MCE family protein [Thioalkalivibrio sp.]|nr:MCE family protein [Thioalkalivibrio sp.]
MNAALHFRLGLFIMGAIAVGVIVLVVMGTGNLLRPTITMETYIDGSVQGLDVGAPIKFRGVTIGEVTSLGFTSTEYEVDVPPIERKRYVLALGRLRLDRFASTARESVVSDDLLEALVEAGLRVRMAAQGITGINYLELDFVDPATHAALPVGWEPRYAYIPSASSTATRLLEHAEGALRRIERLDVERVVDRAATLLSTLERTMAALDTETLNRQTTELITQLTQTLAQSERLLVTAERLLEDPDIAALPGEARFTLESLRAALDEADFGEVMGQVEGVVSRLDRGLEVNEQRLEMTLGDLQAATATLRSLSEDARRNPAGAIFGGPPPRSSLERVQ